MPKREPSLEKQMTALIEEALTCETFCENNPGWVLEARHLLGKADARKLQKDNSEINLQQRTLKDRITRLEKLKEYFEIEFDYKGFKIELWKSYEKGFTYRRRREGGSDWRVYVDYFRSDREAIQAAKSEIDFGEA